jgi:hypothetical protein
MKSFKKIYLVFISNCQVGLGIKVGDNHRVYLMSGITELRLTLSPFPLVGKG